ANEQTRAQLGGLGSGTIDSVLVTIYPLATATIASYGHLSYAAQASVQNLRTNILTALDAHVASEVAGLNSRMVELHDEMLAIQAEIDDLANVEKIPDKPKKLPASEVEISKLKYKQNGRIAINFYLQNDDEAIYQAAKALGVKSDLLSGNVAVRYTDLQRDLVSLDSQLNTVIDLVNDEEARVKRSFFSTTNVDPADLVPSHALKAQQVAKRWAVAGVAISAASAGLTIALALANGRFQPDSPQFSRFLAEQIAAVIVDVFIAVLDVLVVVGSVAVLGVVLAVIAVLDGVISVVCAVTGYAETNPTAASWICGGISGALAKVLSYVINDTTPLVDLARTDRLAISFDTPLLGSETGVTGLVAGNSITLTGKVTTTLYMDYPNWMGHLSFWQWNDNNLDDATFEYQLQASQQDIPLDLNGTSWIPVPEKTPTPVRAEDARFYQQIPIQSYNHTFAQPGINQGLPVYLAEGFATHQQNCWIIPFVCWLSEYDDTIHQPLENSFVFDVWPTSIDELVALTLQPDSNNNNGYRLAWDTTFPTLADADGDGLRSQAMNGPDPDDSNPDSDADGLPDSYELATAGFDPTLSDTDCDGLTDYWEAFYGTNPARPDTDGDGLTDNEEHLHANQNYPYDSTELVNVSPPLCSAEKTTYSGGWLVVYDYDSNGDPLMAQVSADPLDPDSDDDTLSDKQERIYAYNPNVASSLNVLSLDTTIASTNSQLPYVSPSSVISYTAVITNELTLPYARGLVETELPLDNVLRYQSTEAIPPQSTVTVTGSVGLAEAGLTSTGPVNMGIRAGAIIEDPTGRVLWLHMNELAGSSTFADASFLQNDGVCAGANCPTANGQQLTFDGNDTISIPDSADLIGTNYSIAMAVRPTSSGAQGVLFSKTDAVSANGTLSLVLNSDNTVSFNNTDYCGTPSGNFLTSSNSLPVNQWSHIVATLDGAIKRLYINGIEVASISYPRAGECVNTRQVAIGAFIHNGSPTSGFVGQMDEVEVYPEALGANTIADRYATPLLQVDLRNATTWGSDDVSCSGVACPTVGSGGAAFSQVDHLVATAPDLTGDAFAFATWIRPQARTYPMSNDSATAFGKWTDADYQGVFGYQSTFGSDEVFPSLFVGDNGRLRMIWGDGTTTCEVASANTGILTFDNTWQHLVVNYDGSNLTFFVNGEPIPGGTTGSCATVTPPSVSNFYIGRPNNFGYLYFDKATFENFSDTRGTGQSAEMRLNLNSDSSSGNLVWQNNLANDTTTLWTVNKTAVINDSNAWFRVWENNDGGCFISCPEDDSTDTNFDQDWGHTDTSLLHVTGINSTTYLGEQSSRVRTDYCGTICLPTMWGMLDWSNYNDFFKGTLDDFRVYGNALTPAAIADMFRATSMALDLPFDEAPGSDVFGDQSGNAISVSCSGTTCPTSGVPGRFNQALSFDGVDDFLTIGTSSTVLGTSESSFTAMMWIKPDTFWGTGDFGNVPLVEVGNNYDLGLRGYGRLAASSGSFTAWTSNYTLYNATGRWYHLAYVFENGQYTFYVNGVNVGSDWLEAPGTAEILRIGRNSNNLYFDGLLDDLTIVKRALTVAEVQAHFNRAPGINLHLDEGLKTDNGIIINQTITTFRDDSESRYMATCADANTCPDAGDKGQMRESVTFDGNDLLTLSGTSTMVLTDFSVGMWVKPTATSTTNQWLATKSTTSFTSANFRLSLLVNSLTVRFDRETSCGSDSWQSVDADNPLIANQWNHVLATHDATNGEMKIYVNGRLAGITSSIGSSLCTNSSPIRLGQEYDGGMDEVAITPSVLDAEAVGALYNYQAAWYDLFNPYALFVDADLPTVDLSLTPETVGAAQTVLFIGADDATSSVAMVEYRIDGGSWQEATSGNQQGANSSAWLYVFQEVGGTHTIEARATDVAGNVSAIASASILVDTQGPSLTIDNSPAAVQVVDSLPLIGTVSDTGSGVSANGVTVGLSDWNGDAVGGNLVATIDESGDWSAFQTFETEPYGRYTVTAVTQDETGNQTTTTATVSLDNLPPYASVTDDGNYVAPSVVKTISGVASELPYPADSRTLHLHFESGDGLWVDGSKTQFTMLCSGATCPTSGTPGKFGEAITFDGVDDYLMLGGNEAITTSVSAGQLGLLDGSFTIMGWVNGSDWSGDHAVLGSTPITTTAGFYAGIRDGRPILGYSGDDTVVTNTIATDEWVHVVWRYDAATGERAFFVNGVETAVSANHNPYDIGDDIDIEVGRAQGGNPFGGSLDELVVFAQALDAETIYDIANPVNATISNLQLRVRSYDQRDIGQYAGTWTAVTLDNPNALYTTWQYALPTTLAEGGYKIDLRVTDSSGNIAFMEGVWDLAVVAPDLVVTKQTSATIVELNDILQYTITYNNTSIVDAPNVTLSEIVPVDTSFNAGLSHPNWVCADGGAAGSQCTLSLGELPVGASGSISFTVTVTDTWSPGTSAIINTTTIESSAGDANSVDNAGTAQTPINGIIDLELTISQDTTPYQLDDPNFTKVYTFTYANIGTLAATGVITVPLTEYNQIDYGIHPGWTCTFWPFWGCIRELGTVASGETGFVTLTMQATSGIIYDPNEPAFLSGIIGDAAGGTEINTTNNSYTVTTPFETRYTVVLSPTAATIQEGQVITHTGVLTGSDGGTTITLETVDLVGQFYGHDSNTDLDWGWVYTSTDGPGDSQMIRYEVIVGGEAYSLFGTFPLTVVDVAPSVPITGSNSVATGVQYDLKLGAVFDPGDDTVTACSIDWGDGNSDACPINPTGHVASHTYGNVLGFPTITVYLTDEDGTHVAATKAVTVLGVSASVDSDLSSVSAYESITVTNSGTYSPPDATYSWLASEGTVVDEGNGVWSWSLPPGSAEGSRTVTVYADDLQTSFTINVQGDGAATALENGAPNGGDGNNDGTPDSAQMHVASLPSPITGQYVTIAATLGMTLTNVAFTATPSAGAGSLPTLTEFPMGFPSFDLSGMGVGGSADVTMIFTSTADINSYYKYDAVNGWYPFEYDTATDTGAELVGNSVSLYLVDGARGDSDLSANGSISDPGGPAFKLPTYDLTVTTQGGGSVSVPSGSYLAGTVLTLEVTETEQWGFVGWQGALSGSLISQTLTMDRDQSVIAVFVENEYTLDLRVVGNGRLTNTPSQTSYTYNDVVSLLATADPGWGFSGWSGDIIGSNIAESVVITGNLVITGTFTQETYTVTSSTDGNGSIRLIPDQASYVYGDDLLVEAVPNPGYELANWSGDLTGDGASRTLLIDGDQAITAHFVPASYTVITTTEGSGSIVIDPVKTTYSYGDVISVTAVPDQDWQFADWELGLSGSTETQSLTITGNTNLRAIFEPVAYSLSTSWIGDGSVQVEPDQTAFGAGEVVTLTAVAGLSHIFTGWQDQTNDIIFSTNLTTTITITENRSILAIFTPNTVALTLVLSDPHTLTWDNYGDTCTYDMHAGADPWGILPVRGDGDDLLVNFYDISADLADPASNTFYYVTVVSCVPDVTYNRSNTIGEFSFVIVPGQ
ncbi:MAG: DUF11 domain-containing protein, partial [Ardenticatenaceae bacterium]|nr:DUF11 domain-containing protein [Ardenticatenaceae bacterium]